MTDTGPIPRGHYTHDLLLHDTDDQLIEGTRAFVEQGLASGGRVLVHSTPARVALLRKALPSHPHLEYGLDSDLYLTPLSTLFAYQRKLAEDPEPTDYWVTGTVPFGEDATGHPAWSRYESLVNEALGPYAFHGLCTYDTGALPESTIAAAKATHPCVSTGVERATSPDYQDPADFLNDPLAAVPATPDLRPAVAMTLQRLEHLTHARRLVRRSALSSSAVARDAIDGFVTAVNEILVNSLQHGGAPVRMVLWVEPARLTCQVIDHGPGIGDPLAGYRYPESDAAKGLWVARQLCEDIFVANLPDRGCSVVLFSR